MRNETRLVYNGLLAHVAKLNGVPNAAESFNVTPTIQQKLETAIQESSDFLKKINIIGVNDQEGEAIALGVNGPTASRTNTAGGIFLRVAYLQCTNEACGWSVRAQFEMTHEMSPSGMANPAVRLPVAPVVMRRQAMKSADDHPDLLDQLDMEVATA
ncbi:hypothetical protein ACVI9W_000626 [Pseudomonas sp. 210_17 TE3656]